MGFNEHGFRSGGMFLHIINMQDECVFCDWNDYYQRSHIVGWGFTQILSKAPTRKAKSPTFFSVKMIRFDDHLCRLWKCWNHGFSCKLLVATLWRPLGLLKEPCILCSPPARWGLLDFMSVACSSPPLLSSCSTATLDALCSLSDLNHDHPRPVFPAGPQPRPSPPSVPCRTSTTTIHAQCSLPDLNREYPRQVFPAGPQPRLPDRSGHCRTSTASSRSQWALPDLNRELQIPVGTAGPQPRLPDRSGHCRTSTGRMSEKMSDRMSEDMPDRMPERMSERTSEDMPDRMSEDMPDRMSEDMPDKMPWNMPDRMPEDMPDRMPEDIPDRMPEDMPDRMPEGMLNRMPEDLPEDMSDRMPEDLPVRKCINVMVGITRSKVIFLPPTANYVWLKVTLQKRFVSENVTDIRYHWYHHYIYISIIMYIPYLYIPPNNQI